MTATWYTLARDSGVSSLDGRRYLVSDILYQPHWEPGEISAYRVLQ